MKRSNAILISAMALASFAAVVAVQAQDTGTTGNANVTANYNYNYNINVNQNTNAELPPSPPMPPAPPANDNLNTNIQPPLPPTTVRPPAAGTANPTTATGPKLVKIPSPDYIKYFREIRKIGDSLYGIVANGVNAVTGNAKPRHVVTADESACVISAITAKDQAIIAA